MRAGIESEQEAKETVLTLKIVGERSVILDDSLHEERCRLRLEVVGYAAVAPVPHLPAGAHQRPSSFRQQSTTRLVACVVGSQDPHTQDTRCWTGCRQKLGERGRRTSGKDGVTMR